MSKLDNIRAAIVARMNTVTGIGQVHDYERFAKAEKDFRLLYESAGVINGWNVRRVSKRETSPYMGRTIVTNTWQLKGFRSFDDSGRSEIAFDGLVEAVGDAFRADITLGGVVETIHAEDGPAGLQVEDSGPVMFVGVLCHSARLKLNTIHYL